MKTIKLIIVVLAFLALHSCYNEEDYWNDYEVEITLDGDINEFIQILIIGAARNDGEGNFIGEQLLFKDSGSLAPSSYTDADLEPNTYTFVTARPADILQIDYTNKFFDNTTTGSMTISVLVKRDGKVIDDFMIAYDVSTGNERFSVSYNSDNDGFKCYCAEKCNDLSPGYCD